MKKFIMCVLMSLVISTTTFAVPPHGHRPPPSIIHPTRPPIVYPRPAPVVVRPNFHNYEHQKREYSHYWNSRPYYSWYGYYGYGYGYWYLGDDGYWYWYSY